VLGGAVLGVALYYALWGGEYSAFDLARLGREETAQVAKLEELRSEVDSLRSEADALEADPARLEQVARERFGMVREGETLYRFVEVPAEPGPRSSP
jgi:cell division protein FtsB